MLRYVGIYLWANCWWPYQFSAIGAASSSTKLVDVICDMKFTGTVILFVDILLNIFKFGEI